MDFKRAQEIVNSPNHIEVLHNGKSVWIADLDSGNQMAEVEEQQHPAGGKKMVPVNELVEKGMAN